MASVVLDTHAIVWYLPGDSRLSATAAGALDSAVAAGEFIHVPSICLVELTYLVEKGRLPAVARDRLNHLVASPYDAGGLVSCLRFAAFCESTRWSGGVRFSARSMC
jgi:predicted nucleic acid-binding protein